MIIGLSHIGITVVDMDETLSYYKNAFGFNVLDDSERKGEWVEKVTGIPGFHTRNVYVSVSQHQHFELFKFYHPDTIPPDNKKNFQVGISYCAFLLDDLENLFASATDGKKRLSQDLIKSHEQQPFQGARSVEIEDLNSVKLKFIQPEKVDWARHGSSENRLLYAALTVEDIDVSLNFYRDILGLEVTCEGESICGTDEDIREKWVLLKFFDHTCLKLVQPLDAEIEPLAQWRMQKVGITHIALAVNDLDKLYQELSRKQINFNSSPQHLNIGPHKGGNIVYLTTPEGLVIEFIQSPFTLNHHVLP